ncbi:hypothetical protein L3Y34_006672 [Caenorhabditis briggsae]|uniref:G-protein coupled receptors family 1 profile domain-containing protein n=1 Tax=Caenorhabditis briggsae TaxID=6238 RepID=A0AAE9A1Z7_CAEBR|nr:hypothetical protein L3Y34_006672 [Caenorhabditis briggsae]
MVESAYKGELAEIIEVIESIADPLNTANLFLSFVSIFINILHFIILTSSSMKSSSTNVIMIGIAIVDIFTLTLTVVKHASLVDIENNECVTSNLFWKVYFDMAVWGLQDYFRRCSTWLGLMMAIVRTMIVKNILGNHKDHTTLLVIVMTFAFFIAEAPLGIIYTINAFHHDNAHLM